MKTKMKTLLMLAFIGLSVMSFAQTTIYVNAGETLRLKCWSDGDGTQNLSLDTDCQVNLNGNEYGEGADTILARGPFYMEMGNTDDQYLYYDWLGGYSSDHTVLVDMEGEWVGDKYHQATGYDYVGFFWIRFIHIANFTVSDAGGNPIFGATVTVTGQTTQTTDGSGNCSVVDLEDGTYSYSVTASGYDAVNSSFTVSGGDVAVNVQMTETTAPTYTVNFSVSPSTKGISGATVSLTGYGDQVTDGSGTCSFTDIPDGTYSYSVTASGYQNVSGSVTVSGGDVSETVYMDPLGVGNIEVELNVYPNPCVDYLMIDSRYHDVQWTVYNLTGQVVKVGEGEIVDMKDLRAAYYVLKVTSANVFYKKVLKTE